MARAPKRTAKPAVMIAPSAQPPAVEFAEPIEVPAEVETPSLAEAEIVEAAPVETVEILAPHAEDVAVAEAVEAPAVPAAEVVVAASGDLANEIADTFRTLVAKSVNETRARYEAARCASEQALAAIEASYGAAQSGVSALNVKTIEAIQAGADAQFGLLKALASARSISELVVVHTEFARRQYEDAAARAKDLAELARKVAEESSAPLREHVTQTFKVAV